MFAGPGFDHAQNANTMLREQNAAQQERINSLTVNNISLVNMCGFAQRTSEDWRMYATRLEQRFGCHATRDVLQPGLPDPSSTTGCSNAHGNGGAAGSPHASGAWAGRKLSGQTAGPVPALLVDAAESTAPALAAAARQAGGTRVACTDGITGPAPPGGEALDATRTGVLGARGAHPAASQSAARVREQGGGWQAQAQAQQSVDKRSAAAAHADAETDKEIQRKATAEISALLAQRERAASATAAAEAEAKAAREDAKAAREDAKAAREDAKAAREDANCAQEETKSARALTMAAQIEAEAARTQTRAAQDEAKAARAQAKAAQDGAGAAQAGCKKAQAAAAAARKNEADATAACAKATASMAAAHRAAAKANAECASSIAAADAAKKAEERAGFVAEEARAAAARPDARLSGKARGSAKVSEECLRTANSAERLGSAASSGEGDLRPAPATDCGFCSGTPPPGGGDGGSARGAAAVRKTKTKKGKRKGNNSSGKRGHGSSPPGAGPRRADDDVEAMERGACAELLQEARGVIARHEATIATLLARGSGRTGGAYLQNTVEAAVQAALGSSYTEELREDARAATRRAEVTTARLEKVLGDNAELCRIVHDLACSPHRQAHAQADAQLTAAKNLNTVEQYHVATILALLDGAMGGQSHWFESAAGTLAEVATGTAMRVRTVHAALRCVAGEFVSALALMDPTFGQLAQTVRAVMSDGTLRDTVQWLTIAVKLFRSACAKDADGVARAPTPTPALSAAAYASRLSALVADLTATKAAHDASAVEVDKLRLAYAVVVNQLRALQSGDAQLSFTDRRALGIKYRCVNLEASSAQFAIARVVAFCTSALSRVGLDAASVFESRAEHLASDAGVEAHDDVQYDKVQVSLAMLVRKVQGHAEHRKQLERDVAELKARVDNFEELRARVMDMYEAAGYPLIKSATNGAAFEADKARAHFDRVRAQASVCALVQVRLREVLARLETSEGSRRRVEADFVRLQQTVDFVCKDQEVPTA